MDTQTLMVVSGVVVIGFIVIFIYLFSKGEKKRKAGQDVSKSNIDMFSKGLVNKYLDEEKLLEIRLREQDKLNKKK